VPGRDLNNKADRHSKFDAEQGQSCKMIMSAASAASLAFQEICPAMEVILRRAKKDFTYTRLLQKDSQDFF
jgi:hypothetical protein